MATTHCIFPTEGIWRDEATYCVVVSEWNGDPEFDSGLEHSVVGEGALLVEFFVNDQSFQYFGSLLK